MRTTSYEYIYSCFLGNITDYDFLKINEDIAYDFMRDWLHSAVAKPYIHRLFSSISFDDEMMNLTYELRNSANESNEDGDEDFVCEILSKTMVAEWVRPKVNSIINIAQMYGGKEQKWYSEANHLKELRALLEDTEISVRKMIRDHGYINNKYVRGE